MCGFVGCWSNASADAVAPLLDFLRHRGPDGQGVYVAPNHEVAFAHCRLSILDLATGRQPMSNEDGSVWVAFNGEIYNHQELRHDLERAGHCYRTKSDTETLVHAYEEYGADFPRKLNGEFAFVLHDQKQGVCLLARDRLGIRPLVYAQIGQRVFFASEIKALLAVPGFSPEVNPEALDQFLALRYSSGAQSIYRGIYRLPPGSTMRLDGGTLSPQRYWELRTEPRPWNREEALERLNWLIRDSVRLRLMSDVPVGMYLSGGVDSGLILALMAEQYAHRVRTFSIGFGLPLDEVDAADSLARRYGTLHTEVMLPRDAFEKLPAVAAALDEPIGDIIVLPTYYLSEVAARSVKVTVTGEGADELFGAYVHQRALARYARYRQKCPRLLRKTAPWLVQRLPLRLLDRFFKYPDSLGRSGRRRLSEFLKSGEHGFEYLSLVQLFDWQGREDLVASDWRGDHDWEKAYSTSAWAEDRYRDRLIELDGRRWLADYTLFKQDRLTMAHSIEGRVPYLDHRVVEFVSSLPSSLQERSGSQKYLLRRVAARYLGADRANNPKAAFYLPPRRFFGPGFDGFVRDTLSESSVRRDGFFNVAAVSRLVTQGLTDELLEGKRLMAVLILTLWTRARSKGQPLVLNHPWVAGARPA